jgi:hypothetical protein
MQALQKVICMIHGSTLAPYLVNNAQICFHRVWLGTRLTESGVRIPKRECGSCLATLLEQTNYLRRCVFLIGGARFRINKPQFVSSMPKRKVCFHPPMFIRQPFKRHESGINAEHLNPRLLYKYDSATLHGGRSPQNTHHRKYE